MVFSVLGSAIYALEGFPSAGALSVWTLVAGYMVGGIAGGAIMGILRPYVTTRARALMAGPVVALPFGIGAAFILGDASFRWSGSEVGAIFTTALILGLIGGDRYWKLKSFDADEYFSSSREERRSTRRKRPDDDRG